MQQNASSLNKITLLKRGIFLEYLTLGWNIIEVIFSIILAYTAYSVALSSFGLDSLIEIFASIIVIWQLKGINHQKEYIALRLIGISFIALIVFIILQIFYTFTFNIRPIASTQGAILIFITSIIMFLLSFNKYIIGKRLQNRVLIAESRITLIDGYLSLSILLGLLFNIYFKWWWADPLVSLIIIYYAFKECKSILFKKPN